VSSYSYAETFTRVHARRLAGRVTTDLRQSHLLYGSPSESMLEKYREELEELLASGYVDQYQFGFTRAGTQSGHCGTRSDRTVRCPGPEPPAASRPAWASLARCSSTS
jgi:hypothetical protein